jgi:hypothetical protein
MRPVPLSGVVACIRGRRTAVRRVVGAWGARMRRTLGWGFICLLTAIALAAAAGGAGLARAASSPSPTSQDAPAADASPSVTASPSAPSVSSAPAPLAVDGIPFRFRADPFTVREMPIDERPGSSTHVMSKADHGLHDAQGVRMHYIHGKLYDFPRGQSSFGLANLNSYRLTGDEFFLDRALAQADRLLSTHREADGAWYFPTWPSRSRHGRPGESFQAPYYSALTGGRILTFFSRLAEVTGSQKWRDAADHAFLAFLRPGPRSGPYILNVDSQGYYWLEEWPWPGMRPDHTLNGHNTASYGVFEYYQLTHDERAKALFRAAVTTIRHHLTAYRRPGWISCYCLEHRSTNANYHGMHIGQLLQLYHMTGALVFARAADEFMDDYPRPAVRGRLQVERGTYQAVRVTSDGAVIGRRAVTARRKVTWGTSSRKRLWPRSPVFVRANSGPAAGWWLPERAGRVFLLGIAAEQSYAPPRRLTVAARKTLTALTFGDAGRVTARLRVDSGAGLDLTVDRRAVINGNARVRVSEGELAGYWIQLRDGVRLF